MRLNLVRPSILGLALCLATPVAAFAAPNDPPLTPTFPSSQNTITSMPNTLHGRPLTDAPVPGTGPDEVLPSDRAGGAGLRAEDAGPVNSTPFSSSPSGTLSGGNGQTDSHSRADNPSEDRAGGTPNLGR